MLISKLCATFYRAGRNKRKRRCINALKLCFGLIKHISVSPNKPVIVSYLVVMNKVTASSPELPEQCPVWQSPLLAPCWSSTLADSWMSATLDLPGVLTHLKMSFPNPLPICLSQSWRALVGSYPALYTQVFVVAHISSTMPSRHCSCPCSIHCPTPVLSVASIVSSLPCLLALDAWPGSLIMGVPNYEFWYTEQKPTFKGPVISAVKKCFFLRRKWNWGSDTFIIT